MNQPTFVAKGSNGTITVTPTFVIFSNKVMRKEILMSEITAIDFALPSFFRYGSIRLSFRGGTERGLYTLRNNTLMFKRKQAADVMRAKELIEYYRQTNQPTAPYPGVSQSGFYAM